MRFVVAVFAAALMVLTGCGKQWSGASGDVIGTGKSTDYSFTATAIDGTRFDGASLEGKPAVLWFWAPRCPTCRAQIAGVSRLA
jgi:thiol-disulfide isomerase/thioredoxin